MAEYTFNRGQRRTIKAALALRNEKNKRAMEIMQEAQHKAQALSQEAAVEYDAVLLEVLQEIDPKLDALPTQDKKPVFVPSGSQNPEAIRWLDEPAKNAPPAGKAALDAALKELGAGQKATETTEKTPDKEPARPLAAANGTAAP